MNSENPKTFCYKHPNRETRLKCTECEQYICSFCAIQAPVGQKCPDCIAKKTTHLEKITTTQLFIASVAAIIAASVVGFFWADFQYGLLGPIIAYMLGFCVSWSIKMSIGVKIGFRIQILAAIAVLIGILYNPILLFMDYVGNDNSVIILLVDLKQPYFDFISMFSGDFSFVWVVLSTSIALWATTRHLKLLR